VSRSKSQPKSRRRRGIVARSARTLVVSCGCSSGSRSPTWTTSVLLAGMLERDLPVAMAVGAPIPRETRGRPDSWWSTDVRLPVLTSRDHPSRSVEVHAEFTLKVAARVRIRLGVLASAGSLRSRRPRWAARAGLLRSEPAKDPRDRWRGLGDGELDRHGGATHAGHTRGQRVIERVRAHGPAPRDGRVEVQRRRGTATAGTRPPAAAAATPSAGSRI
jgi:hypothetical protein